MIRTTGTYSISTTQGESVRAFVPHALPPSDPALPPTVFTELNRQAELALARLAGVSGLVPSVDWLLYSAIRKEAWFSPFGAERDSSESPRLAANCRIKPP